MPRISSFYGIAIYMYYDEVQHLGRPHFHARYGDYEATVDIDDGKVLAGDLPARARRLVADWCRENAKALLQNWERARLHLPLEPVDPLR